MSQFRILVPTDFSPCSETALDLAITFAKDQQQPLVLLAHVVDSSVPRYDEEVGVLEPEALRANLQMLSSRKKHNVPMETIVVAGQPASEILKLADERDVRMIVMGTHGRAGWGHLLMGSVAESIVRQARQPVLTIKKQQAAS